MDYLIFIYCLAACLKFASGRDSVWSYRVTSESDGKFFQFPNYMYENSVVLVTVVCDSKNEDLVINPTWILQQVECMQDMYNNQEIAQNTILEMVPDFEHIVATSPEYNQANYSKVLKMHKDVRYKEVFFQIGSKQAVKCGEEHILKLRDESSEPYYQGLIPYGDQNSSAAVHIWKRERNNHENNTENNHHITTTWGDGMYHFLFSLATSHKEGQYTAKLLVEMRSSYGFLTAINWPLLPYSGVMSVMYLLVGTVWVCLWLKSTIHTEKIHIFIGAVAVAGALTNTLMFVDMASTNANGTAIPGLSWLSRISASIQSCLTSALLMAASTGYGITRPTLHNRLIVGMAVLTGCAIVTREAVVIVQDENLKIKYNYPAVDMIVSGLYAFTMLVIAAFIMVASILTFIHLWKRRHSQQVVLFCLFMVACIIGFIAELVMVAIAYGWFSSCRKNWKMDWIFANFGSVETLVLLIVLMWLWRPIDRAQSYAFYPLRTEEDDGAESNEEVEIDENRKCNEKTPLENGFSLSTTL